MVLCVCVGVVLCCCCHRCSLRGDAPRSVNVDGGQMGPGSSRYRRMMGLVRLVLSRPLILTDHSLRPQTVAHHDRLGERNRSDEPDADVRFQPPRRDRRLPPRSTPAVGCFLRVVGHGTSNCPSSGTGTGARLVPRSWPAWIQRVTPPSSRRPLDLSPSGRPVGDESGGRGTPSPILVEARGRDQRGRREPRTGEFTGMLLGSVSDTAPPCLACPRLPRLPKGPTRSTGGDENLSVSSRTDVIDRVRLPRSPRPPAGLVDRRTSREWRRLMATINQKSPMGLAAGRGF